jgi:hypothetical protein
MRATRCPLGAEPFAAAVDLRTRVRRGHVQQAGAGRSAGLTALSFRAA